MDTLLPHEKVDALEEARAGIIWLHGLGASGHDFVPVARELHGMGLGHVHFLFPHAPARPVTLNMGAVMPAWYDIVSLDREIEEQKDEVFASVRQIEQFIEYKHAQGIPYDKIIIAGFSQGGAIALATGLKCPHRLGGVLALSAYLPAADALLASETSANQKTPIMMMHGTQDGVVQYDYAKKSFDRLKENDFSIEWKEYPMAHEVCWPEIEDIAAWLKGVV